MSKQGRYQRKKKGGAWKKALIAVACVVVVLCGAVLAGYFYLDSKLNKITQAQFVEKNPSDEDMASLIGVFESTEPPTMGSEVETVETTEATTEATEPETTEAPTEATEPDYGESGKIVNILVVGQDYREGEESHKLADTIMLFTMNKETRQLTATSFLRDSYVNLPNYYRGHTCGWNRINTSYALGYGWFGDAGAMEMLNMTLQDNYGIEVDGDVEIGFDTFEKIIDAFGGLDIELLGDELKDMNSNAEVFEVPGFEPGINHLDGMRVLWYCRMRHSNAEDNDIKRAARQRMVVDLLLEKCKSLSLLELNNILDEVLPLVITNISTDDMKMYIKELLPYVFNHELVSNQCPAEGTYWGEMVDLPDGPGGVLKIDFNQNKKLMMAICEDNE